MLTGVAILIDGFLDNPLSAWTFQRESTRAEALESLYDFFIKFYGKHGLLNVTEEGDGAALWAMPGAPELNDDSIRQFIGIIRRYNGDRTDVVLSGLARLSPPKEPHWYLNSIAARQGERNRGVGARLLDPYIDRSNREGIGIYLESSHSQNLSFYRRRGFVELGSGIDLPEAGPTVQPMWRAPT